MIISFGLSEKPPKKASIRLIFDQNVSLKLTPDLPCASPIPNSEKFGWPFCNFADNQLTI
jgi:hypothetical protein